MISILRTVKIAQAKTVLSVWAPLAIAVSLWLAVGSANESDAQRLQAAAESGDANAEFLLGQAYDTGKGLPRDGARALEYYRRAANHGNAKAQNNLASLYATGAAGVKEDKAEAERWLRKAAAQGAALAQDNLGLMLAQRDDREAVKWFEKAAAQGLLSAQLHLGNLYYNGGSGVEQDYVRAAKWIRRAAEQRNGWAGNVMGVMYQNGLGVKRDPIEAVRWFRLAAELGDAKAQSNLGQMYCIGRGVETDPAEGYKWLSLSAEQKEVTAENFLSDYQTGMTRDQLEAGQKLLQAYKRDHAKKQSRSGDHIRPSS